MPASSQRGIDADHRLAAGRLAAENREKMVGLSQGRRSKDGVGLCQVRNVD
jgi:hypothetical protein